MKAKEKNYSLGEQQSGGEEQGHLSHGVSGHVAAYLQSLAKAVPGVECSLRNVWILLQMSVGNFSHPLIRSGFAACFFKKGIL